MSHQQGKENRSQPARQRFSVIILNVSFPFSNAHIVLSRRSHPVLRGTRVPRSEIVCGGPIPTDMQRLTALGEIKNEDQRTKNRKPQIVKPQIEKITTFAPAMNRSRTYNPATSRRAFPSPPAQAPYVYCADNPIKLVVDRNIVLAIMLSFVFGVGSFPLLGQNERDLSRMDAQKYRIKESSLFYEDTNSFIKVSDALFCQKEIAEINQHTIARVQGYENQRNAYQASFALTLWDWCRETGQSQHVFMNEIGDSTIEIGVRCYSDSRTFLGKEVTANSLHGECLTTCSGEKIGKDSILTMIYTFPQDIHVARLYQFGHRCYLLPLDVEMDECGIYILRIPTNEEGVYTFYNTPNYVCLIRFFPRKNNQNESPGILIR